MLDSLYPKEKETLLKRLKNSPHTVGLYIELAKEYQCSIETVHKISKTIIYKRPEQD